MVLAAVGVLAVALAAAACGGPGDNSATSTTSRNGTTTTAHGHSTTTTKPATTTTGGGGGATGRTVPAGGPVPPGFGPVSFTAVSAGDYWLLGTAPCHNPVCTSIVRTTDGGAHFVGLPAPVSPLQGSGSINTLRFADLFDGYAFSQTLTGGNHPFWDTHDGGEHWSQVNLPEVLAFGTGTGYVYVLTGTCSTNGCTGLALRRSPVSSDNWSPLSVPLGNAILPVDMAVHGSSVWLDVTMPQSGSSSPTAQRVVVRSTDAGAHWTRQKSPCVPGLGGSLEATSAAVVWAVCPTGMMAAAYRSTNAGATWTRLNTPQMPNSSQLAPADDSTAVLAPGGNTQGLLRTADGGASFHQVLAPPSPTDFWTFVGFTDRATGSAILSTYTTAAQVSHGQLWRSVDGGVTWKGPVAIQQ